MSDLKFSEWKNKILEKLQETTFKEIGLNESATLIDGFSSLPLMMQGTMPSFGIFADEKFSYTASIPTIMLLGNKTGRIYLFALKALFPELDI
jgi:hypothetical protein